MTVDVEVNTIGNGKVSAKGESEVEEEKCSYQDLNRDGDCNGLDHKHLHEKQTGKDVCGDASYVFITGNDIAASDPAEVNGLDVDSGIRNENFGLDDKGIDNVVDNAVSTDEGNGKELVTTDADTESEPQLLGEEQVKVESSVEESSEPQRIVLLDVVECKGELPLLDHERQKGGGSEPLSFAESDPPMASPANEDTSGESNSYLVLINQESQIEATENVVQNDVDQLEEPAEVTSEDPKESAQKEIDFKVEQNLEDPIADVQTETETTYIDIPDQDRVTLPFDHAAEDVTEAVLSDGSLAGNQDKAEENGSAEDVEALPSPHTACVSSKVPVADIQTDTGVDGNDTVANETKDGSLSTGDKEIVSEAIASNQQYGFPDIANNLPSKIVSENVPPESRERLPSVTIDNSVMNSAFDNARTEGEVEIFDVKSTEYSVSNPVKEMGEESEVVTEVDNAATNSAVDDSRGTEGEVESFQVKSNKYSVSNPVQEMGEESEVVTEVDNAAMNSAVDDSRGESSVVLQDNECADSNAKKNAEIESTISVDNGHTIKDTKSSIRWASDVETTTENSLYSEEESCVLSNGDANLVDNRSSEIMNGESHTVELHKNKITGTDVKAESDTSGTDVLDNNSIGAMENDGDISTVIEGENKRNVSTASFQGSTGDASEEQDVPAEPMKRPFYYLIKIPRFEDDTLRAQIRQVQSQLDEKTQCRDAIRPEIQRRRVNYKEHVDNFNAAISEEKTLRDLLRTKRKEMESLQAVSNRARNAISVEGIEGTIRNMEHKLQHETLTLKEEKLLIREIRQLKQQREEVSSSMGTQKEIQEAINQKEGIEDRLKFLRKEADLLRGKIFKAEAVTSDARKKLDSESELLKELQTQYQAADVVRQEAYANLQSLKKQSFERNKCFFNYRDDKRRAFDLVSAGDKESLQQLCVNQVETVMEQWNNNFEFRKDYTRCNMRSTLWRLKTLDGRSLGPDEVPPVIPNVVKERVASAVPQISIERGEKQVTPIDATKPDYESTIKVAIQTSQAGKRNKPTKHAPSVSGLATVSGRDEFIDVKEEEHKHTTEEAEESTRKAEQLRKEEEAAKLKEQHRLEEKKKSAEALERKKRMAEKAEVKAALRAQREAELKEKEKEKRARKKDRKKAAGREVANDNNEGESNPISETITEVGESKIEEKLVAVSKKPQKAPHFKLQSKAKSIPPPLRNRGKRGMQTWMWVCLAALVILVLFLLGNGGISFHFGLQQFGF